MTTWDEVQQWLRSGISLLRDEPTWCGWVIDVGGAQQILVVKVTEGNGPLQFIIAGRVCERRLIEPVEALRYNSIADAGALVLEGDTYLLRMLLPAGAVTLYQVAKAIEGIAIEATRLRSLLQQIESRPAAGRACFNHLAE